MIAVVQRVSEASVEVPEENHKSSVGEGLCVLLGVEDGDTSSQAAWMAGKLARLRIFKDDEGRMNKSVIDIGGEILLVSQFTLTGDCSKGNRPSFIHAADPKIAEPLYEEVAEKLRKEFSLNVGTGVFGGMMQVKLTNDGPVTIILRTD